VGYIRVEELGGGYHPARKWGGIWGENRKLSGRGSVLTNAMRGGYASGRGDLVWVG
jgi:hypothetical protein